MRIFAALICIGLAIGPAPSRAEPAVPGSLAQITLSFSPVVKAAAPAVVNIYAKRVVARQMSPFAEDPFFSQFFGRERAVPRVENSLGSGVILRASGIVVSNYHVVGEATDIRVVLADRREFDAEVMLSDATTDLAVIRLVGAADLPALTMADSDAVEVGDLVLAIGNPFGVGQTVSSGIISGLARSGGDIGGRSGYFIQTDAPINPGNSGGALVDMAGRLVGINTSILTRSGGSNGIGFAIPANLVSQYVDQAEAGRTRLARPWAGIAVQPVDGALAEALGFDLPQGVMITQVHRAGAFAGAGLRRGDVITDIAGQPVDGGAELEFRMTALGLGGNAEVGFVRDGRAQMARIKLQPAPETPPRDALRINTRSSLGGLMVANVNPGLIDELDLPLDTRGVVVLDAAQFSARTGLRRGDLLLEINGRRIAASRDLERVAQSGFARWDILYERRGRRALVRLRDR